MCSLKDNKCLENNIDSMIKIFRKMKNPNSLDKFVTDEPIEQKVDLDIAEGSFKLYRAEVSNILSSHVDYLKSKLTADGKKLFLLIQFSVPLIKMIGHGEAHIVPKKINIGHIKGIRIPARFDKSGKMTTLFKNIVLEIAIELDVTDRKDGKKGLMPVEIHSRFDCDKAGSENVDLQFEFDSGPDPVAKIFTDISVMENLPEICRAFSESKENIEFFNGMFREKTSKHFQRLSFLP